MTARVRIAAYLAIASRADVEVFLADCIDALGDGFHPDTRGSDYGRFTGIDGKYVGATFTLREARLFDENMERAFEVAGREDFDLYSLTADLIRARHYEAASEGPDDRPPADVVRLLRAFRATRGEPETTSELLAAVDGWLGESWPVECVGSLDSDDTILDTVTLNFGRCRPGRDCEWHPEEDPGRAQWVASDGAHGDTYVCGSCLLKRAENPPKVGSVLPADDPFCDNCGKPASLHGPKAECPGGRSTFEGQVLPAARP